jgi:hypothetical protein
MTVLLFQKVTADILQQYNLSPAESPIATKSGMVEVVLTTTTRTVSRASINDVAFISTANEINGGFLHSSGAHNYFFV